ncbi:hypothetical protein B0H63DRAFT_529866 [Podospora didyma]|uniref:RRM domain-containing protein n=1 Tax=Podospora didyma TaxID=330526 RepID=A0AAE0JY50_9PEZI|nr:hypothetical protein B0H63DRAFT_529866 [Podospora didyma]
MDTVMILEENLDTLNYEEAGESPVATDDSMALLNQYDYEDSGDVDRYVRDRRMRVVPDHQSIYIPRVRRNISADDLKFYFNKRCGRVKRASINGRRAAYVEFTNADDAENALNTNHQIICYKCEVKPKWKHVSSPPANHRSPRRETFFGQNYSRNSRWRHDYRRGYGGY